MQMSLFSATTWTPVSVVGAGASLSDRFKQGVHMAGLMETETSIHYG